MEQTRRMIVYKAENLINGKVYIGKTKANLEDRAYGHFNSAKKGIRTAFHSAIRKYGEENFTFSELGECPTTNDDLNLMERHFIKLHNSRCPNGYNMTDGGDGNDGTLKPNLGLKMPEETKAKIREKRKLQVFSEESRLKQGESLKAAYAEGRRKKWNKGLTKLDHPSIAKQGFSEGNTPWNKGMEGFLKGRPPWNKDKTGVVCGVKKGNIPWNKGLTGIYSEETLAKISAAASNPSDETRRKNSEAQLGKVMSEEVRQKISATLKGRPKPPRSVEHCLNISLGKRRMRENVTVV
jgi:group I intron endonuclease